MFSNLIDTRYQADYRLMAGSWMRNIWESHLLQINKSSEKRRKNVNRERKSAPIRSENISHWPNEHITCVPHRSLTLIHGRYRCREASAARDTLTGETRRSQGARESFCDLWDLHNHDKERDARRRSFCLHSISYWFDRRCRETTSRLTKEARGVFLCISTHIRATRINF